MQIGPTQMMVQQRDAPSTPLVPAPLVWTAAAVVVAQIVTAFMYLDASSFWIDELHTAWTIDTPDWRTAWFNMLADVHPPLYYLAIRAWGLVFGFGDVPLRAFSALCASLAVVVLVVGTRRCLSPEARILVAIFAVSSDLWLEQSQNVRMYGFGLLVGSLFLVTALGVSARAQIERLRPSDHARLACAGLAAAITHHYLLLMVGVVYGGLILVSRRWMDRAALATGGLVILACALLLLRQVLGHTIWDIHDTWFSNQPDGLFGEIRRGVNYQLGKVPRAFVIGAFILIAVRASRLFKASEDRVRLLMLGLLFAASAALVVAGVVISLLVAPSLSYRNISIAAPALWLGAGALFDLAAAPLSRGWRAAAFLVLAAGAAFGGRETLSRPLAIREDWRGSGAFVSRLPACAGAPLPVLYPYVSKVRDVPSAQALLRWHYRRYLSDPAAHPLPIVGAAAGAFAIAPGTARIMAARLRGRDPCSEMLWAVHLPLDEAGVIAEIRRATGVKGGRIAVRRFTHFVPDSRAAPVGARVFLVAEPAS